MQSGNEFVFIQLKTRNDVHPANTMLNNMTQDGDTASSTKEHTDQEKQIKEMKLKIKSLETALIQVRY